LSGKVLTSSNAGFNLKIGHKIRIKKTYEDIKNLHETYFSAADNAFCAVIV
jgi:hypothetical protein